MAKYSKLPKYPNYWVREDNGVIYWRGSIHGKSFRLSTKATKIREAKKFMDLHLLNLTTDNLDRALREGMGVKNPLLSVLWKELLAERCDTKEASTVENYHSYWRVKMEPFWGNKHLSDMTQKNVIAFENWFITTFKGHIFFNTGKQLRMFINYLYREKYISTKPVVQSLDKTIGGKLKKKRHFRIYTQAEQNRIINCAYEVTDRAALALMAYFDTGLRKMELLSRKWEDIDFDKKNINVWSAKNKNWRKVPLTHRLLREFKDYQKTQSNEFIFAMKSDPTRHQSSQVFDKEWVKTKAIAKIKGRARIHDIRHTFATKTAITNWPMAIACSVLDMSADEYMKTYVHITDKDKYDWIKKTFE